MMNPLTELKERLVYISVAGTQLLSEDFRLKKATESFAPLAEKNPVFKKIYTDLQKLLGAEKEQQGFLLLNLLGLIDAVLYTQASSGIEGNMEELSQTKNLGKPIQIRYSQIAPLLQALSTTGSGRMEILCNTIANYPYYFQDYRILHALINDLTDSYTEMAKLVYKLLKVLGTGEMISVRDPDDYYTPYYGSKQYYLPQINQEQLIAQLKQGFDLQGKQAMVKRVSLVAEIAKEKENEWYFYLLENANKNIRNQAILSLGCSKENIPRLMEMLKTEKGKAKEAVYKVLSEFDDQEMISFWIEELKVHPELALNFKFTNSNEIADVIAENFKAELINYLENEDAILAGWKEWLPYKPSDKVLEIYQWCAENQAKYSKLKIGTSVQNHLMHTLRYNLQESLILSCPSAKYLHTGDKINLKNLNDDDFNKISSFLNSITLSQKSIFDKVCFAADLLTLSASEVYEKWNKNQSSLLMRWFQYITYTNDKYNCWLWSHLDSENMEQIGCTLKEPLDPRWFDFFILKQWDSYLFQLTPQNSPEINKKVGEYFYQKAIHPTAKYFSSADICNCMQMMKQCGCEKFEGILEAQCRGYPKTSEYTWVPIFKKYRECTSEETTYQEAKRVVDVYNKRFQNGKLAQAVKDVLIEHGYFKVEGE